jgi:TupA-like ATPgrasp
VIVRDRSKLDVPAVKRVLNYGLRLPHGRRLGEHWYAAIEPRIIVEPLLQDRIYDIPTEYMFHVFHGRAAFVQVASSKAYSETPTSKWVGPTAGLQFIDRSQARFTWYGLDWQPAPFQNQGHIPPVSVLPGKPVNAGEMICVAEKLAGDWGYVRVDFRCVAETQLYFGEMTFSHASGYSPVVPHDYNRVLGDLWDIRGRYVRAR